MCQSNQIKSVKSRYVAVEMGTRCAEDGSNQGVLMCRWAQGVQKMGQIKVCCCVDGRKVCRRWVKSRCVAVFAGEEDQDAYDISRLQKTDLDPLGATFVPRRDRPLRSEHHSPFIMWFTVQQT